MKRRSDSELRLDPARSIIAAFGEGDVSKGIAEVAGLTGRHATSVQRWMYPKEVKGTGGIIPIRNFEVLSEAARERGIELPVDAFVPPHQMEAAAE